MLQCHFLKYFGYQMRVRVHRGLEPLRLSHALRVFNDKLVDLSFQFPRVKSVREDEQFNSVGDVKTVVQDLLACTF